MYFQPKVVTDLDEEEIKRKMELMELEGGESDEQEDDDGLVAPKGLDQQADAEEATRKAKGAKDDEEDEDSD